MLAFHFVYRGEKFRTEFSHLDEVRSIIPKNVNVMALTATATRSTRKMIIKSLCMQSPEVIYIPPVKGNIIYDVIDKPKNIGDYFKGVVDKLKNECTNLDRIIIFCKTYNNVLMIYRYFKRMMGKDMTEPKGSANYVVNRLVDSKS